MYTIEMQTRPVKWDDDLNFHTERRGTCTCGWNGEWTPKSERARRDALTHSHDSALRSTAGHEPADSVYA